MAEWGINTLLFHFLDDHNMSIQLPDYEKLVHSKVFSIDEIKDLIAYGKKKVLIIIPELGV